MIPLVRLYNPNAPRQGRLRMYSTVRHPTVDPNWWNFAPAGTYVVLRTCCGVIDPKKLRLTFSQASHSTTPQPSPNKPSMLLCARTRIGNHRYANPLTASANRQRFGNPMRPAAHVMMSSITATNHVPINAFGHRNLSTKGPSPTHTDMSPTNPSSRLPHMPSIEKQVHVASRNPMARVQKNFC